VPDATWLAAHPGAATTPCTQLVADGATTCRAGHPCPPRPSRRAASPPVPVELVPPEAVPAAAVGSAYWASVGVADPAMQATLAEAMVTPGELARPVALPDGRRVLLGEALTTGAVPLADAPVAVATWPGAGWCYRAERFCWTRAVSDSRLAAEAWRRAVPGARRRLGARFAAPGLRRAVAKQMAAQLALWAAAAVGPDLVVSPTAGAHDDAGWCDGLDAHVLAACATAAVLGA